jgi:hypothetical protein
VISLSGHASVSAASCTNWLVTGDSVMLDPDAEERKFYKRRVGLILEIDRTTGDRIELARYQEPPLAHQPLTGGVPPAFSGLVRRRRTTPIF